MMNHLQNFDKYLENSQTLKRYQWEPDREDRNRFYQHNNVVYEVNVFYHKDGDMSIHAKNVEIGSMETNDCRIVEQEIRNKIIEEAKQTMRNLDILRGGKGDKK